MLFNTRILKMNNNSKTNLAPWRVLVLIQVGSATPRRDKHTPLTKRTQENI